MNLTSVIALLQMALSLLENPNLQSSPQLQQQALLFANQAVVTATAALEQSSSTVPISEMETSTPSVQNITSPMVEWITPTSTTPSQTIYVNGTGFQNGLTVQMGSYYLDIFQVEPNQITAVIPNGVPSGEYHIFVINPNGDNSSLDSPITVTDPPDQTPVALPVYTRTYPCFTETFIDGVPEYTSNFPVGVNCN